SPTATATSTTPCSPPSVTTSDASSAGSPLYSVSAWPSYSLKPLPCQPEKSILHPRLCANWPFGNGPAWEGWGQKKCRSETASYSRQNKVVERSMLMTIPAKEV